MADSKKFQCRVIQNDAGWKAEIIRRVSSKRSMVSKKRGGFATQAEAQEWGESKLQEFMKNQAERNKRHAEKRG